MNPDVAAAIDRLATEGILEPEVAHRLSRVARRELVSLRAELRLLLYAGALAFASGASLLVYENLDRIGPITILAGLWTATLASTLYASRHAPAFSWGRSESAHLAFDYVLLLAVLLFGSSLAYSEVRFLPFGELWPLHLLLVSLVALAAAVRGDSRVVFGVALSTFAAWRGVSLQLLESRLWSHSTMLDPTVANALLCGALFILVGRLLLRLDRKAHFEPVALHAGWLLVLGALVSEGGTRDPGDLAFALLSVLVGAALATWSLRQRRPLLFALGVVAGYIGLSMLVLFLVHDDIPVFLWFAASAAVAIAFLLVASRRFGVRE